MPVKDCGAIRLSFRLIAPVCKLINLYLPFFLFPFIIYLFPSTLFLFLFVFIIQNFLQPVKICLREIVGINTEPAAAACIII